MIKFEPRDLWVGVYWNTHIEEHWHPRQRRVFDVYMCVVPMFPVHLSWRGSV